MYNFTYYALLSPQFIVKAFSQLSSSNSTELPILNITSHISHSLQICEVIYLVLSLGLSSLAISARIDMNWRLLEFVISEDGEYQYHRFLSFKPSVGLLILIRYPPLFLGKILISQEPSSGKSTSWFLRLT